MVNILIVLAVLAILGGAALYIYKEKKAGATCVGCPYAQGCGGKSCGTACSGESRGH